MRRFLTLMLALALSLGLACAQAEQETILSGGWSVTEEQTVTEEINNLFQQAMDSYQTGTITIAYTPVAVLGTQVVAGTNYAILCRASEINRGRSWVIVYLYQDLEGNASVLSIADLALGI